ncbi:MAG: hypothetical protein RBT71_09750 [Flavobacteriales bacterium]|nr:hypothetical protein [Flavobacteriales bacterium]
MGCGTGRGTHHRVPPTGPGAAVLPTFGPKQVLMDIMGFILDNMGHFSAYDVPNKVFAMLAAALAAFLLGRFGARAPVAAARELAVWAALAALALAFVRVQLPLAIALVALVLAVRAPEPPRVPRTTVLGALVFGMGCGAGAVLPTLVLAVPYILLVRWAHAGSSPE